MDKGKVDPAKEEPRRPRIINELRLSLAKLRAQRQQGNVTKEPAADLGIREKGDADGEDNLDNHAKLTEASTHDGIHGSSICEDVKGSLVITKQVMATVKNRPGKPTESDGTTTAGVGNMNGEIKKNLENAAKNAGGINGGPDGGKPNAGGKNGGLGGSKPKLVVSKSPIKTTSLKNLIRRAKKAPVKSAPPRLPKGSKDRVTSKETKKSSTKPPITLIKHYPFCNICGLGNPLSPPVRTFIAIGGPHKRNRFVCQTCHKGCTLSEAKTHHESCYLTYDEVYFGAPGDEEPGMKNGRVKFRMVACDKCTLLTKMV